MDLAGLFQEFSGVLRLLEYHMDSSVLWGMMVMVEGMAEAGFFDWLCLKIAKLALAPFGAEVR